MRIEKGLGLFCLCLAMSAGISKAQFTFTTSQNGVTITGYTGRDIVARIPERIQGLPVTAIGQYAFYFKTNFLTVTIPGSVTAIGDGAFQDCRRLTVVRLGNGVASIGQGAFSDTGLRKITIPASVTNIAEGAFDSCAKMNSIRKFRQ